MANHGRTSHCSFPRQHVPTRRRLPKITSCATRPRPSFHLPPHLVDPSPSSGRIAVTTFLALSAAEPRPSSHPIADRPARHRAALPTGNLQDTFITPAPNHGLCPSFTCAGLGGRRLQRPSPDNAFVSILLPACDIAMRLGWLELLPFAFRGPKWRPTWPSTWTTPW